MGGVELPVGDSRLAVGCGGVGVSLAIGLPTAIRLVRLLRSHHQGGRISSSSFTVKRLAIHTLILLGVGFVLPLYILYIVKPHPLCIGLIALQRFQFICIFATLGLILNDWRIDVYEGPQLRSRRLMLYRIRDYTTVVVLVLTSAVNLVGPWLCLNVDWLEVGSGYHSNYLIDSAYFLQVLCAFLLLVSMLYSGLQMRKRLLWASRSPLTQQNDLFRTAILQLTLILMCCSLSFISQVVTLTFNVIQEEVLHKPLVPNLVIWVFGAWLPSLGWSFSCLFLGRKPRRQSFVAGTYDDDNAMEAADYVRVLLSEHEREDEEQYDSSLLEGYEES